MSEPPPFATRVPVNEPPPPLPTVPLPPPPPASMAYSVPTSGRPGAITTIGVISIIVAVLGALAYAAAGFSLAWFSIMARFAGVAASTPPPSSGPALVTPAARQSAAASPPNTSARGLHPEARANVAAALTDQQEVSDERLAQLDGLLARAGKDMFPPQAGKPLTQERAAGMMEGVTVGLSADPNVPGPDTFRTPGGRVEIYDDRAVFYPLHGRDPVRTSRPTATMAGPLTDAQVQSVIDQAQAAAGNSIKPAQVTALRTLLTTPGQKHVSALTLPSAIRSANQFGDSVFLQFPNSSVVIGPQGQTTVSGMVGGGTARSGAAPFGFSSRSVPINGTAMALTTFSVIAGIGLAVYLFVIGIMVLRGSPRGRRLHQIYAGLALVLVVMGTSAAWWLASSFSDELAASSGLNPMTAVPLGRGISLMVLVPHGIVAVLGCIYPIVLLILLQTSSVKQYYRTSGG